MIFVCWKSRAPLWRARLVRLDSASRVIYNIPYMSAVVSLPNHRAIIPNASTIVRTVGPSSRPPMPDWCLKIQQAEEAKLVGGPIASDSACIACSAAEWGLPVVQEKFMCIACLEAWHLGCAFRVQELRVAEGVPGAQAATIVESAFVCPVCLSVVEV